MLFVAWQGAIAQVAAWAGVPGPLLVASAVKQISLMKFDIDAKEEWMHLA